MTNLRPSSFNGATMQKRRTIHFGLRLNQAERETLARLAEAEGLSESATLRRLLRRAVKDLVRGEPAAKPAEDARDVQPA